MASTASPSGSSSQVIPDMTISRPFTCNLCTVSFPDNSRQRTHMQSSWHIYNLKRRVASLAPVSSQIFNETVLTARAEAVNNEKTVFRCSACQKVYDNPKTYQNHLRSRIHLQKVGIPAGGDNNKPVTETETEAMSPLQELANVASNLEALNISHVDDDDEDEDNIVEEEEEDIPAFDETVCLFCLIHESPNLEENMSHMQKAHGFFIPDLDSIIHLPSLLAYLHILIVEFHECLACGKVRASAEGVRAHMCSKGHCTVNVEELEEFYDLEDDDEEEEEEVTADFGIGEGPGNRKAKTKDLEVVVVVPEDDKLVLPSGKTLGHRSKTHLYRQHLPSPETRAAQRNLIAAADESETTSSSAAAAAGNRNTQLTARAKGELGLVGLSEAQRRSLRAVEKKIMRVEMRVRNQYQAAVEKAANRQKHYRADDPGRSQG